MLKQEEEALKSLEAAMRAGFENYEQIRTDKNLAIVRQSPKFQPLLDKVGRAWRSCSGAATGCNGCTGLQSVALPWTRQGCRG
jgi:hypothetical protein